VAARPARIEGLDPLRGLAALAVLCGHGYALGGRPVPLTATTVPDWLLTLTPTGVWLFFALSGFVISRPYLAALVEGEALPPWRDYAIRRVLRIFPLYLVCAAVVVVCLDRLGTRPRDIAAHLLLLHNLVPGRQQAFINVAWTLSLELLFYASVPLLAVLLARRTAGPHDPERLARMVVAAAAASAAVAIAAGLAAGARPGGSLYVRQSLVGMWSAFSPGLLIAVWWADRRPGPVGGVLGIVRRLAEDRRAWWTTIVLAGAAAGALAWAPSDAAPARIALALDLGRLSWSIVYGLLILRVASSTRIATIPRPLRRLGDWSYGIYLIHGTLLLVLLERFPQLVPVRDGGLLGMIANVALLLGLTLPLAAASWHLLERPAMELARRGRSRRGRARARTLPDAPPPVATGPAD